MVAGAAALIQTTAMQAAPVAQADEVAHAAGFNANLTWSTSLADAGDAPALSSPNVANLDGQPSVVVGDLAGKVYAYHLSDGTGVAGWPYNAGAPIQSSPSVAPISPGGTDSVFVGTGDAANPTTGGYQAITNTGGDQWFVQETNPGTDSVTHSGVSASLTVGNYAGGYGVEAGSLGQNTYALGAGNGAMLGGFPWFQADSVLSTAAVADLYGDGNNELISGGDSSAGLAYGQTSRARGMPARPPLRVASSASTTPPRTSTARRPPSDSSSPAARSASSMATGATTRAPRTRTRSSPSTPAAAWPGVTSSTASPPTHRPWPT
jgi:hypothetical protein